MWWNTFTSWHLQEAQNSTENVEWKNRKENFEGDNKQNTPDMFESNQVLNLSTKKNPKIYSFHFLLTKFQYATTQHYKIIILCFCHVSAFCVF